MYASIKVHRLSTLAVATLALALCSLDAVAAGVERPSIEHLERQADTYNSAGDDAEVARTWAAIARHPDATVEQHASAALQVVASARRAFEHDPNLEHICLAHAVLKEFLERDDARADDVEYLRPFMPEIERQLHEVAGDAWRPQCQPPVARAEAKVQREPEPRIMPTRMSTPSIADRPAEDQTALRLTIAGATTMVLGSGAIVGMSVALARGYREVDAIYELAVEADDNDGGSEAMDLDATQHSERAERFEDVAIGFGVAGAVSLVTGVALLAAGQTRRHDSFALTPVASRRYAGVALTGRF